jgi:dTDP-4-amino-4,6-dideoxygalactose transaminase
MKKLSTIDLTYENQLIKKDFFKEFDALYDSNMLMIGSAIDNLEKNLSNFCETNNCALTGAGTMALEVAARAIGIRPGDEVIVPANTFFASAIAMYKAGAKIVLCDVDPHTMNVSSKTIEGLISKKTKAICLVHLYGAIADPNELKEFKLPIIEDASHAFGGVLNDKKVGNLADIAGFSAGPIKGFGGLGHAGFITYNQDEQKEFIEAFIGNGQTKRHYAKYVGNNYRIDSVNALFMQKKLDMWQDFSNQKRKVMDIYDKVFDAEDVSYQKRADGSKSTLWVYVIQVSEKIRDKVREKLLEDYNINTIVQYNYTIDQLPIWSEIGSKMSDLNHSHSLIKKIISLPIHAGITESDAKLIADATVKTINDLK